MKKLLLSFAVLSAVVVTAQVGINTDAPKATLDISAKDNQKGNLRIEGVEEKFTQWLLVWDEKDQMVKRISLSDLKREIIEDKKEDKIEDKKEDKIEDKKEDKIEDKKEDKKDKIEDKKEDKIEDKKDKIEDIVDKNKINYIRERQPDRADEIINKIKQCTPENILFDKHFGDGKHDFVYCATTVSEYGYNRTWLNLNLGAAYADIHNPNFNPTVSEKGEAIHSDKNLYGSLYQWQRASDGHEFKNSPTTKQQASSWTNTGDAAGKLIVGNISWVQNGENATGLDLLLWRAGEVGVNNPCPSGYYVPTRQDWDKFIEVAEENYNDMWSQNKLPNLVAAGYYYYYDNDGLVYEKGSHGYYWSSSASTSNNAYNMYFNSLYSATSDSYNRAVGYSVRCIKDNN